MKTTKPYYEIFIYKASEEQQIGSRKMPKETEMVQFKVPETYDSVNDAT